MAENSAEKNIASNGPNKYYILFAVVIVAIVAVAYILMHQTQTQYNISVSMSAENLGALYPYNTTYFIINLTNLGSTPIEVLPFGFYVNGVEQNYTTYSIPAHNSIRIERNYTYTSNGIYTFSAIADPGEVIKLANRNDTKSIVTENVSKPEIANVYTSIPNNNIVYTESFSGVGTAMFSSSLVSLVYNLPVAYGMVGFDRNVNPTLMRDLYGYIASANGAYVKYANNTKAYSLWLSGTINPRLVDYVVSSFSYNVVETQSGGVGIGYVVLNKTTSICTSYAAGWTKIVEYYNSSLPGTCSQIESNTYVPSESNALLLALEANKNLAHYQSGLIYVNSTPLGNMLQYDGHNLTLSNMFQISGIGTFIGSVGLNAKPISQNSVNSTCLGLVYTTNNIDVCSTVLPQSNGAVNLSYGLVDSKMLTPNYNISMYSVVSSSELVAAHGNAANLMARLNVSGPTILWHTPFVNSCNLNTKSIACNFYKFNYSNDNLYLNITNLNYSAIKLNNAGCNLASASTSKLNYTIALNHTRQIILRCTAVPIAGISAQTEYNLGINFTYNNHTMQVNGTVNITNSGIG